MIVSSAPPAGSSAWDDMRNLLAALGSPSATAKALAELSQAAEAAHSAHEEAKAERRDVQRKAGIVDTKMAEAEEVLANAKAESEQIIADARKRAEAEFKRRVRSAVNGLSG